MAIETEKKYRLDKPAMVAMADKLRELGATFVNERFERNFMYRNGIPDETNAVLRIRKIGESTFLTYKERIKNDSEFKTKIEHETLVSDAEEMEFIVAKLGYKLVVVYEKHRKTFHLGECEVVLDELPFGQYMEIEGEPEEILKVEKMLGAEAFQTESRGYSRLTAKFGKEEGGVKTARFERAHTA
jgi:adenylate cyclase, class 2